LLSGLAAVQATEVDENEDRAVKWRTHSRTGQTISHRSDVRHMMRKIRVNGVTARLHTCLNDKHKIVPCDHIHIGFTYDRNLVTAIMDQLPRFVHKHTIVYKMYTTLKLYYLHQQELLNQVLAILKEHVHSAQLAAVLKGFIARMHGKNFGWISSIEALLKSHMKADLDMRSMHAVVRRSLLVHHLHTIIHNAAARHHAMIGKMFSVLRRKGFVGRHYHAMMSMHRRLSRGSKRIMRRMKHVFKMTRKYRTTRRVVTSSKVFVTRTVRHTFRSYKTATRTVKHMLLKHSSHSVKKALKKMLVKAKTKATVKNLTLAIKALKKKGKKAKK
jgi:hypothetical protein